MIAVYAPVVQVIGVANDVTGGHPVDDDERR